jgi:predicted transcriptional regulator of viral defense system
MKANVLKLIKKSRFSSAYAKSIGLTPRMLNYYVQKGALARLAHDLYALPEKLSFDFTDLVKEKVLQAPDAVIGGESALVLYGLTEQAPAVIDLYVSVKNVPKCQMEDVKLHRVQEHLLGEGVTQLKGIRLTSIERTVVDMLRKGGGLKQALETLSEARKKQMAFSLTEIERLGNLFRAKEKVRTLLEAL